MDHPEQGQFNPATLMRAVGDDPRIYREMCALFLRTVPDLQRGLHAAADLDDIDTLRRQAHSLRGSCMLVGAEQLCRSLQALERMAAAGQTKEASTLAAQVTAALGGLLEEIGAASGSGGRH